MLVIERHDGFLPVFGNAVAELVPPRLPFAVLSTDLGNLDVEAVLDRSTDMQADTWEELDDSIDGGADVTVFIDSIPIGGELPANATRLYYRVRRL